MIDLHLHLDGSLSESCCELLAKKNHIDLGEQFPSILYVPSDCPSLKEYLTRFELPLRLLQDRESIEIAVKDLIFRLNKLGYIYAEIRFAPLLHLNQGLTQFEVVEAAIKGLEESLNEYPDFDANLILCCMRHAD